MEEKNPMVSQPEASVVPTIRGQRTEIIFPNPPNIPLTEGVHVVVGGLESESDTSPKHVVERFVVGLGVAKAIAESGVTPEPWANTRIEKNGTLVSVYGRSLDPTAWRKPVDTVNRTVEAIHPEHVAYNFKKLRTLLVKYAPMWEAKARNIHLFASNQNKTIGQDVFEVLGHAYKLWENDAFDLVLIKKEPHVAGLHFIVSPKKGYARQWQTVRGATSEALAGREEVQPFIEVSAEGVAIALGVQALMGGKGEIHNSGNWAANLNFIEDEPLKGRISKGDLLTHPKAEKRRHRPDIATDDQKIETYSYFHVYIPEKGPVILPTMKRDEAREALAKAASTDTIRRNEAQSALEQWNRNYPPTEEQLQFIQGKLGNGMLSDWLQKNFSKPLLQ